MSLESKIVGYIAISPFTKKQLKSKNGFVGDHLLFCNIVNDPKSNFSILTRKNK